MPQQLTDNNENCLNCGFAIQGNYCTRCGQPVSTGRINFTETINNFLSLAFALEGPLLLTIRLLIVNPGKLFREYIAGKRKTYYKPVAFFILSTALYLILRAWIGYNPLNQESVNNDLEDPGFKLCEVRRSIKADVRKHQQHSVFSCFLNCFYAQTVFWKKV